MTSPRVLILSGIPPGTSGTGRLLRAIVRAISDSRADHVRVLASVEWRTWPMLLFRQRKALALARELLRYYFGLLFFRLRFYISRFDTQSTVIVFHPQSLGMRRTISFLSARRAPAFLFLLDNSFFCIRSYNHIPGEMGPCLRCVGGNFRHIVALGCVAFPKRDTYGPTFVQELHRLVRTGHVKLLAQNRNQAELARRHFGPSVPVPVVGLWVDEWTACLDGTGRDMPRLASKEAPPADVVFHGFNLPAKGAAWLLTVAALCPHIRFLFPFHQPTATDGLPANCIFRDMSWETGLAEAVRAARLVVNPTLWSASIEGALVKSIMIAHAVAVIETPTAYAEELPEGLVLRLSPEPVVAATQLSRALENNWEPNHVVRKNWLEQFRVTNEPILRNILRETTLADTDAGVVG